MKKLVSILCMCLICSSISAQTYVAASSAYAGGDGSKANPYQIATAAQLAKFADDVNSGDNWSRGKYFVLTADIVVNENLLANPASTLEGQKAGTLLKPIGTFANYDNYVPFMGVFDGQGHTISGMYQAIYEANEALFRAVENAVVKNVHIRDAYIYGGKYCAGVVSFAVNSTILNCSFEGEVKSWEWYGAGIAGQITGSSRIQNCYAKSTVNAKSYLGGIVGIVGKESDGSTGENPAIVENCYSISSLTATNGSVGMIAGRVNAAAVVRNCYYRTQATEVPIITNYGTAENLTPMSEAEFAGADFTATLNTQSQQIAGACRWTQTATSPTFDYTTFTPEEEVADINNMATDPIPADEDLHAESNGEGRIVLRWKAPANKNAATYTIYIGENSDQVAAMSETEATATLLADTTYTADFKDYYTTLYWRVDCTDSQGKTVKGEVWSFRPAHLAFPEAEGYGRFAKGGRGGKVVYVTNLNATGEGSLHWALTNGSGPRTVLFKVAGLIDMNFNPTFIDDEVTIAGQTAPGKGICLMHCELSLGSDNICRFLRARRGGGETGNAIGIAGADHTIADHVTASWGTDETFSSRNSKHVTFQRSIIAEALGIAGHKKYPEGTNHGYAATIGGDIGSFHHNLLANCSGRNWSMGGGADASGSYAGRLDIFNNVVYNWATRTTDGGAHQVNFVGNYYKMGHATTLKTLCTLDIEGNLKGTQSIYVKGNVRENLNGTLTTDKYGDTYTLKIRDGRGSLDWEPWVSQPFFPSYATIETAQQAYKSVLSNIGANLPVMDNSDLRIVNETLTRSYTYTGSKSRLKGQIDNEADAGGFELYPEEAYPDDFDTDLDGLPDWWEEIHGTSIHSVAGDFTDANADPDGDGYTMLETYLDFMAQPHYLISADTTLVLNAPSLFRGYTKTPVYRVVESGDKLQVKAEGETITVKPVADNVVSEFTVAVTDAEGDEYMRRITVGVSNKAAVAGVDEMAAEKAMALRSYSIYTIDGLLVKNATSPEGIASIPHSLDKLAAGVYVMVATDMHGKRWNYKIVK
ncbi:MAG: hypothetical protein IJ467_02685 [Bacteroidaceae bacterium]|nr:hypothetical protein [Bacteroidaceae bacterium]